MMKIVFTVLGKTWRDDTWVELDTITTRSRAVEWIRLEMERAKMKGCRIYTRFTIREDYIYS